MNWLVYPAQVMLTRFPRAAFMIQHRLTDHPLLRLPRLIELARSLPEPQCEYNSGDLPVSQDYLSTPRTGLSALQTLAQIEQCHSWMVLKNVEHDPQYAALLDQCLQQLAVQTETAAPGMLHAEGFIFVSSPGSITPYHMDPEHNFLLQVQGSKRVTVFDGADRSILSEEQLESFHAGAHRNMQFRDEFAPRGELFELTPGNGLYIPVTAPHWVANGPSVSISLSITFRTLSASNQAGVYRVNAWLRRRGFAPVPPGRSAWRDAVKVALDRATSRWQAT
jgi:hypothetical protein